MQNWLIDFQNGWKIAEKEDGFTVEFLESTSVSREMRKILETSSLFSSKKYCSIDPLADIFSRDFEKGLEAAQKGIELGTLPALRRWMIDRGYDVEAWGIDRSIPFFEAAIEEGCTTPGIERYRNKKVSVTEVFCYGDEVGNDVYYLVGDLGEILIVGIDNPKPEIILKAKNGATLFIHRKDRILLPENVPFYQAIGEAYFSIYNETVKNLDIT